MRCLEPFVSVPITVSIPWELLDAILEGARRLHPRETILLLRGKKKNNEITISDLLVPPLANYGHGSAVIRFHMVPMDLSIIGTAHSHPSGVLLPSHTDLNQALGVLLIVVGYPYQDEKNVAAFDRHGESLHLSVKQDNTRELHDENLE